MDERYKMIAVCGLDCSACDIYKAPFDAECAQRTAEWFKEKLNIDIKESDIHCPGCRGKRDEVWSPDCKILKCCADDKGHDFCFECGEFPCDMLNDWAGTSPSYSEALNRLMLMKNDNRCN